MTTPNDPYNPGPPPPGGGYAAAGGPPINNWLVPSILTVFCCWPLAIPAIINATKVNNLQAAGDIAGAQAAADSAKRWTFIALGAGVVIAILYIVLVVFLGVFTASVNTTS